jgi:steroid 5-alpha reductase family enzyme
VTRAFSWIVVAYALALGVAIGVGRAVDAASPLWTALWADVAATCVVFAFSVAFRNSSFYDAYWSLAPIAIVVYWLQGALDGVPAERQGLVALLVFAWGIRLTLNWARGWAGLAHEDWRYVDLQAKTGRLYWLVSFSGIHMMPTLWVFGGCLALYPALATGTGGVGALDLVAAVVTGTAIWLEFQADQELRRFRTAPGRRPEEVLDAGLWAFSRHPNYLGEMGFWWGLFLFGLAADPSWWWTAVGPLAITLMFRFASLPMIETRMLARRPEAFAAYRRRTPMVLPRPWSSGA